MRCFVRCCLFILLLDAQVQLIATYEDSHQYPVEFPDFGPAYEDPWPKHEKQLGEACLNSDECRRDLCCVLHNGCRECRRRAMYCKRCSEYQLKGGYYKDYCPCLEGQGQCHTFPKKNYGLCYFGKER
ncbi:hypothetical protein MTO96_043762 [Rhipicephalus appendiculatus]